ncbi:ubiquinol-cytochrome c reductase iron-sulfur subunit [Actinorhabdospora filicis]|uniref:Cytochrome bc1 complex Rieske iron-sulfur subunit n=1 Tax=Actinorhabdospora filicis TaxID=1785913 RepID=A0A9W6SQJ6_9ACTN|nr:Rieske 2Fe-2S domain-containing protein [Actinorhabdospora filicis]GLZ80042.1 ubiquinol-cytochrome c reductase iron-sulfur subunit [Actinorhabdospora filicis]
MSKEATPGDAEPIDVMDPKTTQYELVKEALRRDGIEILHYEPRYEPGSKEEKRVERTIAFFFALTGLGALGFIVTYIWWPYEYEFGGADVMSKWYTPMLGLCLGVALAGLGLGVLTWAKKLLPKEEMIQERHDGASEPEDRKLAGAVLAGVGGDIGIHRRPLLKRALLFGAAPLGLAALMPIGGLIKDPKNDLFETGFNKKFNNGKPVRLMREDGTLVRPEDVSVGGQITVFPAIPGGASLKHADSPTLLIHLREADAEEARKNAYVMNQGSQWQNFIAYSKICTHVGCPASLYEQQTNRLLCPCHQSQFHITDNAKPIFGPATRSLPQLPLDVDEEGYLYATEDYKVAIGPAFWEREKK